MSREALRQMGRFAATATLSAAPSANVFLQCTVIIHFGMLSWLTSKKYIGLTAISKRPAANAKFAINSFQQPLSLLFIGYFGSHKLEIFVSPAIISSDRSSLRYHVPQLSATEIIQSNVSLLSLSVHLKDTNSLRVVLNPCSYLPHSCSFYSL